MSTYEMSPGGNEGEQFDWRIDTSDNAIEVIEQLDDVLASKDIDQASEVLKDTKLLHSLIINRGEKDSNLNRLKGLADLVIKDEFGPEENIETVPGKELVEALHERGLPEQVLGEMMSAAYHQRDPIRFFRVYSIIKDNAEHLRNKELILTADHNLATWTDMVEDEKESAANLNRKVLDEAMTNDLKILSQKTRFGLTAQKQLKPRDRARGFDKIAGDMELLEHHYDAQRARLEEIKARMELVERQEKTEAARTDNIERSKELAKQVLEYSLSKHYGNLEVLAWEAQALIARTVKDGRKAAQFQRKADTARERFLYRS